MEKIFDIAKDSEQSWGTLAAAIDKNYNEIAQVLGVSNENIQQSVSYVKKSGYINRTSGAVVSSSIRWYAEISVDKSWVGVRVVGSIFNGVKISALSIWKGGVFVRSIIDGAVSGEKTFDEYIDCDDTFDEIKICTGESYSINVIAEKSVECIGRNIELLESRISLLEKKPLNGIKWNDIGDSNIQNGIFSSIVAEKTGLVRTNYGLASSTIAVNNTYLKNESIYERITSGIMDESANVWTILGGSNDYNYNSPLGDLSSKDPETVYGAIKGIIEFIINLGKIPVFCTLIKNSSEGKVNSKGYKREDIRKAVIECCEYYSIDYIDLWAKSGINEYNLSETTRDGAHINEVGAKLVSVPIINKLKELESLLMLDL